MNILIVEDDDIIRSTTKLLISKWRPGSHVSVAINGNEGLEKLMSETFDLAFLDNSMPGLSGIEIAESLQSSGSAHIPWLVALSGNIGGREGHAFIKAGINDAIEKPLTQEKFLQVLENANLK